MNDRHQTLVQNICDMLCVHVCRLLIWNALVTKRISPHVYQELYDGCQDDAVVTAYITEGGGRNWVADDEVLWAFFSNYARTENGELVKLAR